MLSFKLAGRSFLGEILAQEAFTLLYRPPEWTILSHRDVSKEGAATMPAPSPELKVIQLFGEGEGKQSCLSAPGRLAQHGGRIPPQGPEGRRRHLGWIILLILLILLIIIIIILSVRPGYCHGSSCVALRDQTC